MKSEAEKQASAVAAAAAMVDEITSGNAGRSLSDVTASAHKDLEDRAKIKGSFRALSKDSSDARGGGERDCDMGDGNRIVREAVAEVNTGLTPRPEFQRRRIQPCDTLESLGVDGVTTGAPPKQVRFHEKPDMMTTDTLRRVRFEQEPEAMSPNGEGTTDLEAPVATNPETPRTGSSRPSTPGPMESTPGKPSRPTTRRASSPIGLEVEAPSPWSRPSLAAAGAGVAGAAAAAAGALSNHLASTADVVRLAGEIAAEGIAAASMPEATAEAVTSAAAAIASEGSKAGKADLCNDNFSEDGDAEDVGDEAPECPDFGNTAYSAFGATACSAFGGTARSAFGGTAYSVLGNTAGSNFGASVVRGICHDVLAAAMVDVCGADDEVEVDIVPCPVQFGGASSSTDVVNVDGGSEDEEQAPETPSGQRERRREDEEHSAPQSPSMMSIRSPLSSPNRRGGNDDSNLDDSRSPDSPSILVLDDGDEERAKPQWASHKPLAAPKANASDFTVRVEAPAPSPRRERPVRCLMPQPLSARGEERVSAFRKMLIQQHGKVPQSARGVCLSPRPTAKAGARGGA